MSRNWGAPIGLPTAHRKVPRLDADTVAIVKVVCACGWTQDEELALDAPEKRQLAEASCGRCGVLGLRRHR